ncbi:MAG: hypothetical protein ABI171_09675 [Collimonas sp.]|uniref:hypothetical protein n=1 Tax=Collimonas sp. TaxID=1963772 RepID=UPI0032640491
MWQASPQIAIVPFIRGNRYSEYMGIPGYNSIGGGMELRYTPVKGWNITPGLSGNHQRARLMCIPAHGIVFLVR